MTSTINRAWQKVIDTENESIIFESFLKVLYSVILSMTFSVVSSNTTNVISKVNLSGGKNYIKYKPYSRQGVWDFLKT